MHNINISTYSYILQWYIFLKYNFAHYDFSSLMHPSFNRAQSMSCHHPGKMHIDLSRNMKFSYILGVKGKYSLLEENNGLI